MVTPVYSALTLGDIKVSFILGVTPEYQKGWEYQSILSFFQEIVVHSYQ